MFFHVCKQPVIIWGEIWRAGRMCQYLSAPLLHQILQIVMAMTVALSWSKMIPCSSSSGCLWWTASLTLSCKSAQKFGHGPFYQLAQDGQAQVYLGWRTWCAWLSEHPDCPMQFSTLVTFRNAIQYFVVSAKGQMNESMTHQPLKRDQRMHCLHFSNAADGWWQEHRWLFGHR